MFLILRSPMKLLSTFTFARTISHKLIEIYSWFFACDKFTIRTVNVLHFERYTGKYSRYLFRLFTSIRFGATLVERYTEHSSDLNGRSTCYVRSFRRVPFSCTVPPPLLPHLLPFPGVFAPPPFGLCISLANTPSHRPKHASARRISQGCNEWNHYEGAFSKKMLRCECGHNFKVKSLSFSFRMIFPLYIVDYLNVPSHNFQILVKLNKIICLCAYLSIF